MMPWYDAREYMRSYFGDEYAEDDTWFCPECGEPIINEDFPEIEEEVGVPICPVCGFLLDT